MTRIALVIAAILTIQVVIDVPEQIAAAKK